MSNLITSRKNPIIKEAAQLAISAQKRNESGLFLVEGARLCEDAAKSGVKIIRLFYTGQAQRRYEKYIGAIIQVCEESYEIEEHVCDALAKTKSSQGVFCVCEMRKILHAEELLKQNGKIAVLENLQDPSNLGTVLRTAEALGIKAVILAGECCDIYSLKTLRASMGAVFRIKIFNFEAVDKAAYALKKAGYTCYASVVDKSAEMLGDFQFSKKAAVFIGNEGNGLTDEAVNSCDMKITIPMQGRAESLNAAGAAAILLWEAIK